MSGCKNMLYQQSKDGTGEICIWGRHVFMGYLEMEDATMEAIDEEGWLHTGDLGRVDSHGFLYITGRIKGTGAGSSGASCGQAHPELQTPFFPRDSGRIIICRIQ